MFFCYERNKVDGQYQPIVYYDEEPRTSSQSKEATPVRSTVWSVPEDCCDPVPKGHKHNGHNPEPNFGRLQARFKRPS